jgi:hypothetical protein
MPRAAGMQSRAIAQKVVLHPAAAPSTAPAGTPATVAIVVPDSRMATARPVRSAGTSVAAVERATARKPAFAKALSTLAKSRREKLEVRAART